MSAAATNSSISVVLFSAAMAACGSPPEPEEPGPILPSGVFVQQTPGAGNGRESSSGDAPEISRSKGTADEVVVLWPRIVLPRSAGPEPSSEIKALARRLQTRLAEVAKRALPAAHIDVRPEPERVCPKDGCTGVAVGALLAVAGQGCGIVAHVSDPGASPMRLVPYAAQIRVGSPTVPFREPVERAVGVTDYVPCSAILHDPPPRDADVEAALKAARR